MSDFLLQFLNTEFFMRLWELFISLTMILLSIILLPFDLLIGLYFPDLSNGLVRISQWYDVAATYVGYGFDALLIPASLVSLIATYYLAMFTISISVYGFKLLLKWKKAIFF